MTKIDLKDAYFLVPVRLQDRKFLRFSYQGQLFQYICLPFGLSTSPHAFTKIMKPVVHHLCSKGWISCTYLDDILCDDIAPTVNECRDNVLESVRLLSSLGFIVNKEKSCLTPATRCEYLGFIVDSQKFRLELPLRKRCAIKSLLDHLLAGKQCSIRTFARLIGFLVLSCPAIAYGMLYSKQLERIKQAYLVINDGDFDGTMRIPLSIRSDLEWWSSHIMHANNSIKTKKFSLTIFSDAPLTGWGAACNNRTGGLWSAEERVNSINYLGC